MSRIDDLIAELCPEEVEFSAPGEIGTIFGGLTGKSKADFADGNARIMARQSELRAQIDAIVADLEEEDA